MNKIVDIYMPLDQRQVCCDIVWPVAKQQLQHLITIIEKLGWQANLLNPDKFVSSIAQGIKTIKSCKGSRLITFLAGWTYPDFVVTPLHQADPKTPKLILGSTIPNFPGAVGLLAAASGLNHVGIKYSRLYVEHFNQHNTYEDAIKTFLDTGSFTYPKQKTIDIPITNQNTQNAIQVKQKLKGMIYGGVGPRSMEMWNKISEADFLKYFGISRMGFDGLRLLKMTEKIEDQRAQDAYQFLIDNNLELKLGPDPDKDLTKDQIIFQMKVYLALLQLKDEFKLDFVGVQDQLDWIQHYPATDLSLGLLNNKLRPESDGQTFVAATEVDDGAAITMQTLKLITGGQPVGFNDLRYWNSKLNLYWFVNSGSLAPYFAQGSHDSFKGAWTQRQTPMYFAAGGGTCTLVVKKPGTVTWARYSYQDGQLYLCAGRGITDVPTEQEWLDRSEKCSRDWPQWYLKLCGNIENHLNTNHPMTVFGDHLADLKALAQQLNIPFQCYDTCTPAQLEREKK